MRGMARCRRCSEETRTAEYSHRCLTVWWLRSVNRCGRLSLLNHEQERRDGIRQTIGRHEVAAFKIMLASRHPGHVARLEMFAREPRAGWDIWGKEIYQPRLFPGLYAVAEARARILAFPSYACRKCR